jgi:hypothetical protein
MQLPAIRVTDLVPAVTSQSIPMASPITVQNLPRASSFQEPTYGFVGSAGNLSQAAKPVFEALQSAAAFPPSAVPSYVLPVNGSNFLRLFTAVQEIAAERIYPAPVFSFQA